MNTALIFWYFGGKLHIISSSGITFWTRYESFTRKVKREGTSSYFSSSAASLKDKPLSWCHRLKYTASSRKSVFVTGSMIVIYFDIVATVPFLGELTEQQEYLLTEKKAASLDLHHIGLGPRLKIWQLEKSWKTPRKTHSVERDENFVYFISKHYSLAKSPGHAIKDCFSGSWTLCGGNIMWYALEVRNHQIFEDICYRLRTLCYYVLRVNNIYYLRCYVKLDFM